MRLTGLLLLTCLALAAGPEQDAFEALDAKATALQQEMQALRLKYAEATGDERAAIAEQFNAKARERNALLPELFAAAEKAYLAQPNAHEQVTKLMPVIVANWIEEDRHEQALRLAELLIAHEHPNSVNFELAGTAAFSSDRFDKAEQLLAKGKEMGGLSKRAQDLLTQSPQWQKHWETEQAIRRAEAEADDLPRVKLETTAGTFIIELYENEATNTVANFINLVEKGFYDGVVFHRVLEGFMAQGGDPTGTGSGGPGWSIKCECHRDDYRRHFSGTLSMAHAGRDTGGSQFFITFVPTPHLDGKHTAFGRVIEGRENLPQIVRREPRSGVEPSRILKATVVRKRDHAYEPQKLPSSR